MAHIHEYHVQGKDVGRKHLDPTFPSEVWNCHERVLNELPRTTSLLEGFHEKLNRLREASHLNMVSFISKLHDVKLMPLSTESLSYLDCLPKPKVQSRRSWTKASTIKLVCTLTSKRVPWIYVYGNWEVLFLQPATSKLRRHNKAKN